MSRFYITTPLYYINGKPHIGTVYSTVLADVLNRYHQLFNQETFFLTGTDEHGQKCVQSAKEKELGNQEYCDMMAPEFENTWKSLDISYNMFFRTTWSVHKQAVQKCLWDLYNKKQIYESDYEGWYCVDEEAFYTKKDLVDGLSPSGKKVTHIKEKNYFFKMSNYQERLIRHIQENPQFIQPEQRRNEVLSFLKQPLTDLCISRPKSRLSWGVEIPFDKNFVTYVWIDALLNYVTGIGYQQAQKQEEFQKWWLDTGAVHIIGKDILLTHCVYWPCLLMALNIRLPKTILAHGWILNSSKEKMSKSTGEKMKPADLLKLFDKNSLRYFLIGDIPVGNDTPVSLSLIAKRINEDLSNNLGNLFRRITKMLHEHFHSQIPKAYTHSELVQLLNTKQILFEQMSQIQSLKALALQTAEKVKTDVQNLRVHLAVEKIVFLLSKTNKYLEQNVPWKLIKTDKKQCALVLRTSLEVLYLSAVLLKPVMPEKMNQLLESLSCPTDWPVSHFKTGKYPKPEKTIQELPPLFPKIKLNKR